MHPFLTALTLLSGLLFSAFGFAQWGGEQPPAPIRAVAVSYAPLAEQLPLTGTVVARNLATLSPQLSGQVRAYLVDAGDSVEAGQVLVELDDRLAQLELEAAEADLRAAQVRLSEAKRQLSENEELYRNQHIGSSLLEAARSAVNIAQAEVETATVKRNQQQERVHYHQVAAPFDGVIAARQIDPGEWVNPGTPMFTLVELEQVQVDLQVPQFYFSRVRPGQPVEVRFDAYPERTFAAHIDVRVPLSEAETRTFLTRILMDNPEGLIVPGMSARVRISLVDESAEAVIQVPRDAVLRNADGSQYLYRVVEDQPATVEQVQIRTGQAIENRVAIVSGDLQSGDLVVVEGNETLTPGREVRLLGNGG